MNYGIPYKGSKNKIAENIIAQLPSAKHFYDLFGGGGAITDCAIQSNKWTHIIYNEIYTFFILSLCLILFLLN